LFDITRHTHWSTLPINNSHAARELNLQNQARRTAPNIDGERIAIVACYAATKSSYLALRREYSEQFSSRQAAVNGSCSNLLMTSAFGKIYPELI